MNGLTPVAVSVRRRDQKTNHEFAEAPQISRTSEGIDGAHAIVRLIVRALKHSLFLTPMRIRFALRFALRFARFRHLNIERIDLDAPAQHAFERAQHRLPRTERRLQRGSRRTFDQQLRAMHMHHLDDC